MILERKDKGKTTGTAARPPSKVTRGNPTSRATSGMHIHVNSKQNQDRKPPVDSTELDRFIRHFRTLVECESPSMDHYALSQSARVHAAVGKELLGVAPRIITVSDTPHLLWRFGTQPRKVVMIGHHDTVWPIGTLDTMPFAVNKGVITGPGTDDMKGGNLIALYAAASVQKKLGSLDGLSIFINGDEELGSPSSRHLIETEAHGASAALVFESGGPDGELKAARKGVALYGLNITGRAAHAGVEPERGINATVEAAHQILTVERLNDPAVGTSVIPTAMHSGTTTNTVPAEAQLDIDSRALTVAEQLRVDSALHSLTPHLPGALVELTGGINRPPMEERSSRPLIELAQHIADSQGLPEVRPISVGGGSDGNFTAGIGVPTVDGLGTVGGGSHADDEHALIDWIGPRTTLTASMLEHLLTEGLPS